MLAMTSTSPCGTANVEPLLVGSESDCSAVRTPKTEECSRSIS